MKTRNRETALLIALVTLMTCSLPLVAQETSWEIGPRRLPPSAAVSEAFHESLSNTPTPDVTPFKAVFGTDEEWKDWAEERDTPSAAGARALAEALNIGVLEDKIGGVNVQRVTPPEIDKDHQIICLFTFMVVHGSLIVVWPVQLRLWSLPLASKCRLSLSITECPRDTPLPRPPTTWLRFGKNL
jgi:hypothetical protein